MGLNPGTPPHARDHHVTNTQVLRQLAAAPVRGAIRRRSAGPFQNPGLQRRGAFLHRASGMVGVQARQPLSFETTLPPTDIVGVASQNLANRQVGFSSRQQHDQPRAAYIFGRQRARAQPVPQFRALTRRQAKLSVMHAS
jgi:hypothetical protein